VVYQLRLSRHRPGGPGHRHAGGPGCGRTRCRVVLHLATPLFRSAQAGTGSRDGRRLAAGTSRGTRL